MVDLTVLGANVSGAVDTRFNCYEQVVWAGRDRLRLAHLVQGILRRME